MAQPNEKNFQNDIVTALESQGWLVGKSADYDQELALYPEDVLAYFQDAHPDQWAKFSKAYPQDPEQSLLKSVAKQLEKATAGTLDVLRHGFKDRGAKIQLCQFKPDHTLNPDTLKRYELNRLRVVPELVYSPHGYEGRLDLTLFLNGLPIATVECKCEFKQAVKLAIKQYKQDRSPKDKATKRVEPLLAFKRGALVHFAVSELEVFMTTMLAEKATRFLPFNRGTKDGGAGNDSTGAGYPTAYLWEEILAKDNLLKILGRYMHLEVQEEEDWEGKTVKKETMIFPRFHQWDVVNKLLAAAKAEGPGEKYLVQHSAGSGKSNSIAWASHQLSSLHDDAGEKVFDSVIVVTDRTVLDDQLQDTIYQFEHAQGVVARISRDEGQGSKSQKLAEALGAGASIIIVTIQTFPFVLEAIQEQTSLKERNFAVIADEAHSSQTGKTASKLKEVLMAEQLEEGVELSGEDLLDAAVAARKDSKNISYFAFTATPKPKTLELFGRRPNPALPSEDGKNLPESFHVYSMRQAIEEGFILDVLKNYTTYKLAYKLAHANPEHDQEVDEKKAKRTVAKWVRLHPYNISQKVEVIVEHFRTRVAHQLNGQAKAMVVTSSRKEAVRYKLQMDKYIKRMEYAGIQAMVAFSGEVEDSKSGPNKFTETNMNPGLKGREMRRAFDTDDYQVMIVANKFQTGFDQPKLCAMYVDRTLKGVDCVQTLSRLNRTKAGKDKVFVLDFINDPEEVFEAFKPYYETTMLATESDPNLVYELFDKLKAEQIYLWQEVEAFATAFYDPKASQASLIYHCKPAKDRYGQRYHTAVESIRAAQKQIKEAKKEGNNAALKHADADLKNAKEDRDKLDVFKKDLGSFVRFYEFMSQIIEYDDRELEQLSVYARNLLPLLREERIDDDIDLSEVEMTHYRLSKIREQHIILGEDDGEDHRLGGTTDIGGAKPKDPKAAFMSQIIETLNTLFEGEGLTDGDLLSYAGTIAQKVRENKPVMQQIQTNTREQAMIGDFPKAVEDAVLESMGVHQSLATQVLGKEQKAKKFAWLLLDMLTGSKGNQAVGLSLEDLGT